MSGFTRRERVCSMAPWIAAPPLLGSSYKSSFSATSRGDNRYAMGPHSHRRISRIYILCMYLAERTVSVGIKDARARASAPKQGMGSHGGASTIRASQYCGRYCRSLNSGILPACRNLEGISLPVSPPRRLLPFSIQHDVETSSQERPFRPGTFLACPDT